MDEREDEERGRLTLRHPTPQDQVEFALSDWSRGGFIRGPSAFQALLPYGPTSTQQIQDRSGHFWVLELSINNICQY